MEFKSYLQFRIDGRYDEFRDRERISKMIVPVVCNFCREVYDLCDGVPIHRYADCTLYKTPCCGRVADDRQDKANPDFKKYQG